MRYLRQMLALENYYGSGLQIVALLLLKQLQSTVNESCVNAFSCLAPSSYCSTQSQVQRQPRIVEDLLMSKPCR